MKRLDLNKTIPLSLAILLAFNTTIGVAFVQHYVYKRQINELLTYKERIDTELANTPEKQRARLQSIVISEGGVELPIKWESVGQKLFDIGVIDQEKFSSLFKGKEYNNNLLLTQENSRFLLNTLWALGLAQQSDVLDTMKVEYPQVDRLAATGGWTLGKMDSMSYYSQHNMLSLSDEDQAKVGEIAQNIYRPCCDNHTAFADCNHGMAMLGLIEVMVSGGYSEEEIYAKALEVNSVWFPDTYMTIAKYMEDKLGIAWDDVNAKEVLGKEFSSGSGYRSVLAQVTPLPESGGGGGCGA